MAVKRSDNKEAQYKRDVLKLSEENARLRREVAELKRRLGDNVQRVNGRGRR